MGVEHGIVRIEMCICIWEK